MTIDQISELIEEAVNTELTDNQEPLISKVAVQDEVDIATLLESLPLEKRLSTWEGVPTAKKLEVLVEMRGDPRETLLQASDDDELDKLFSDIDAETLLELSDSLPNKLIDRAVEAMDKKQQQYFVDANQYSEDQIGHWANKETLVLPITAKVSDAKRFLRRELPSYTDCIYLINRAGQYSESVKLYKIYSTPEHTPLVELAEDDIDIIKASEDCTSAALTVQRSGFTSLPLVDDDFRFLGRVDIGAITQAVGEVFCSTLQKNME